MPDPLVFLMGKHPAPLPGDLRYCKNHMWCRPAGDGHRFGFSSYAIRLMQDVYFLEWKVDAGAAVRLKQDIGFVESSKAQSELYAPLAGTLTAFNPAVLNDPSLINADGYVDGYLFDMTTDPADTLDAAGYHQFLTAHWEQTQRLLKKQIHLEDD
jgi:glycine cleavage system H protein